MRQLVLQCSSGCICTYILYPSHCLGTTWQATFTSGTKCHMAGTQILHVTSNYDNDNIQTIEEHEGERCKCDHARSKSISRGQPCLKTVGQRKMILIE